MQAPTLRAGLSGSVSATVAELTYQFPVHWAGWYHVYPARAVTAVFCRRLPACRLGAYAVVGGMMGVRSPLAYGESLINGYPRVSRPERPLPGAKVAVGGHRLLTPADGSKSNSVILQA